MKGRGRKDKEEEEEKKLRKKILFIKVHQIECFVPSTKRFNFFNVFIKFNQRNDEDESI